MLIKEVHHESTLGKGRIGTRKKIVNHSFISTTFALRHSWSEYVNDIND